MATKASAPADTDNTASTGDTADCDSARIEHRTREWVQQVVIGHTLCPFARKPVEDKRLACIICPDTDTATHLQQLADTLVKMKHTESMQTALLVFPDSYRQFDDYLDLLALSNALLTELGYDGTFQLASFHPDYLFAGSTELDAANYSNRSPYPMLHLLREADISLAVESYPDIDKVPERNMKKMRALGLDYHRATLRRIMQET